MAGILKFLGTDSGFGKNNTSAWLMYNKRFILIDCGYTVFPKLQEHNLLSVDYDYDVIITHLHSDHVGSLGQLAAYMYYTYKKPINIISNCENLDLLMSCVGTAKDFCDSNPQYPRYMYTRNNNYDLKFIKTEHVHDLDCYGFVLQIENRRIVYTGDSRTIEPFLEYVSPDTEFYIEASTHGDVHLDIYKNLDTLKYIADNSAGVYLMHLDDRKKIFKAIEGTNIKLAEAIE
ncbi:MAG: MBL fold metallo-hydrolase [Clostridia bacterium]|nr:MBL fold metallo-hydrolase [Clostridia bacterium]